MPSRIDNAKYVIDQMRLLGVPAQPGSRLMKMYDILLSDEYIPFDDPDFPIALQSDRDLGELGFIFEQLHAHSGDKRFRQLCKDLLLDSTLPQDDRENSQGRDSQFELYLAAICHKAGMKPVGYDEPDITCHVDGTMIGIAAKRIKNERQGQRRINKAAAQIEKAGRPGIIALEMSVAWNRNNVPVTSQLHHQAFNAIFDEQAGRFLERHGDALSRSATKNVLGIVAFKFSTHAVNGKWKPQRAASWREFGSDGNPNRIFNQFYKQFTSVTSTLWEKADASP